MEISVQNFIDRIQAEDYTTYEIKKTASVVNKSGVAKQLEPVIAAVSEAVATGHLCQAQLVVTGKITVTYRIETGIINLPFENSKKVAQFFDTPDGVPVNIYLITAAENLNLSGFRIDLMGTSDDLMTDEASISAKIAAQAQAQWAFLEAHPEGVKPEAPAEKAVPAAKTTKAKTPAKTTKRKTTTKKKPAPKK
ncbi:hypothetical protein ACFQ5M_00060 [Agrilactobacillus yilanensis]|uniref:Uncharacterized protein n=1 Tax=Agrilactobacillus yilanensis TaxID=2485997 RepID=A0ABW4J3H2_9LACO|nr:hypothetical protein [Agrilactobacillus yilanensis]